MAQQPPRPFRRFLQTGLGRIVLIVIAVLVVFATYVYVSAIVAIPAILLFGLAVPIWVGLKRPRFLALLGLVIVLTVAPLSTIVITQDVLTPVGLSNSATGIAANGEPVMQNATVTPFTGTTSTNFTWTVTVFPVNVPTGNTTPVWLDLYVSTCPGATGNSSPYCSQPYPLTVLNQTLPNQTSPYTVTFHYKIGANGIWDWQMGLYTKNRTSGVPFFQTLVGDPQYNGIEGPVIGGFATIYSELLLTVYFQDFLFLGAPFYFVLLIYMLFKNRERRKKEAQQRAAGPIPPSPPPETTPGSPGGAGAPLPSSPLPPGKAPPTGSSSAAPVPEFNCPKCNAVVYAGESTCWKCGAPLSGAGAGGSAGSG